MTRWEPEDVVAALFGASFFVAVLSLSVTLVAEAL